MTTREGPSRPKRHAPIPTPPARYDPDEVKAFTEYARWLHAYHDKRSDVISQRATTILGFAGITTTLLLGGVNLGKDSIRYTWPVRINIVVVLVSVFATAFFCIQTLTLRTATVPNSAQVRRLWNNYGRGGGRGLVHGQIADAYLGGAEDPVADASNEADSRAASYKKALYCFITVVATVAALTIQALLQQT